MNIAAIIVGIDGWHEYTGPLLRSIEQHEPNCHVVIIDNASATPYPTWVYPTHRTDRLCYSAAINHGKYLLDQDEEVDWPDWYIVLSNDVLCTGPFAHLLEAYGDGDLVGLLLKQVHGFPYLEGWCVCVPARAWQPWDENFQGSDYEDASYSTSARERGFGLIEDKNLPFVHLDQRQRYHIVDDFAGKNAHNRELFLRKHAKAVAA